MKRLAGALCLIAAAESLAGFLVLLTGDPFLEGLAMVNGILVFLIVLAILVMVGFGLLTE